MSFRKRGLVAAAALLVFANVGSADQITQRIEINLTSSGGLAQQSVQIPAFPSELGELQGVTFTVEQSTKSLVLLENLAEHETHVETDVNQVTFFNLAGLAPIAETGMNVTDIVSLGAFDGDYDWYGESGYSSATSHTEIRTYSLSPSAAWTTAGSGRRVEIEANQFAFVSFAGSGRGLATEFSCSATATVSVTYTF
ncbi:MAG: hypothetical protein ACI8X5_002972 [Planctomycetota bacterium]|jgi:hypothetical protein